MLNVLLVVAAVALVAAEVRVWSGVIRRWTNGQPLVPRESDRVVPWGLLDVVVAIALLFAFSIVATGMVNRQFGFASTPAPQDWSLPYCRWSITALACASLATLVTAWLMIKFRYRATIGSAVNAAPAALLQTAWRDVRLGTAAFLVLAPPIYALQLLLVQWFDSKHPVVERLLEYPDPGLILASVFSAVLVAPVFEEFLFRGLLQGWLEKLVTVAGWPTDQMPAENDAHQQGRATEDAPNANDSIDRFAVYLPIVASSSLFAALHVAHGPDWIPLFFLALGLGYLYQQTHRLLPSITVHFLLNAFSMALLLIDLKS